MKDIQRRWLIDPMYLEVDQLMRDSKRGPSDGRSQLDWFKAMPQVAHPTYGLTSDCRGFNWDGKTVGEDGPSGCCIDESSARHCTFNGTSLQSASAQHCDFTGSRFIAAQMSPIYAAGSVFRGCFFDRSYLMGVGPRDLRDRVTGEPVPGVFSDLRDCDLRDIVATKTGFDRCDFRGADLRGARFVDCKLSQADMRCTNLAGAVFESCDFQGVWLDDLPPVRAMVKGGRGNSRVDGIQWVPV